MDTVNKIKAQVAALKNPAVVPTSYTVAVNDFSVDLQCLCKSGNNVQSAADMQISVVAYLESLHLSFAHFYFILFYFFDISNILEDYSQATLRHHLLDHQVHQ